jgi:hypothetical protein
MKRPSTKNTIERLMIVASAALSPAVFGQQVTFAPYLQLGDNGPFGPTDQIVVAWQTDEASPKASAYKVEFRQAQSAESEFRQSHGERHTVVAKARVVDNYLAADPSLPAVAGAYGAHSNYTALLSGLRYDTEYQYRVTGPGMPAGGFSSTFHTRPQGPVFSSS